MFIFQFNLYWSLERQSGVHKWCRVVFNKLNNSKIQNIVQGFFRKLFNGLFHNEVSADVTRKESFISVSLGGRFTRFGIPHAL